MATINFAADERFGLNLPARIDIPVVARASLMAVASQTLRIMRRRTIFLRFAFLAIRAAVAVF